MGWFPTDEVTIRYLQRVYERMAKSPLLPKDASNGAHGREVARFTEDDIARWSKNPPRPDPDAIYAARIVLDLNQVTPHVSGPDTVQTMQSVTTLEAKKVAIQKAYLVSCANSRVEDLEAAARVLRGKKVAPGVKLYVGAASSWVQQETEKCGAWQTLLDAGAIALPPSCGPCIGLGTGLL